MHLRGKRERSRSSCPGRSTGWSLVAVVALALLPISCAPRSDAKDPIRLPITIVAEPGPFEDVATAAGAEERVDWWDGDPRDDDACTESFAATELRDLIASCPNVPADEVRLASPARVPGRGTVIVVGTTASVPAFDGRPLPAPASDPGGEAFRIRRTDRGGLTVVTVAGASRVGALYGAYALLERLGFRFQGLGDMGTVRPSRLLLPARLDASEAPGYVSRGFWAWEPRGNPEFFRWMARNRMNLWTVAEGDHGLLAKLGIRLVAGGHHVQKICLDPDVYYPDHPEWYGLVGGRRDSNLGLESGTNFCTSNPEASGQLAANVVRELESGAWRHADVLAFWMLDGGAWCTCAACRSRGEPTDRVFDVLHVLSDSLAAARRDGRITRDVEVTTLAFLETLGPPTRPVPSDMFDGRFAVTFFPIDRCYVHPLADLACRDVNGFFADAYLAWVAPGGRYRGAMEVGEYYNIGELKSLPVLLTSIIRADVPWYFHNGARRFHTMHVPTRLWGTWTVNHVLLARLLWNPAADADSILDDFWSTYYPSTGPAMRRYAARLEVATASFKLLKQRIRIGNQIFDLRHQVRGGGPVFLTNHLKAVSRGPGDDPRLNLAGMTRAMRDARAILDSCRTACTDSVEALRLADEAHRFAYGEATLDFYAALLTMHALRLRGDDATARGLWPTLEGAAVRLRGMRDVVQVSASHANAANGFEATRMTDAYETLRRAYAATR